MMATLLTALLLALAPQDSIHVRVLAMTDFHGALESRTYPWTEGRLVGGAAVLKAAMDSAEAQCGCPTLRIDAGDQMQGIRARFSRSQNRWPPTVAQAAVDID